MKNRYIDRRIYFEELTQTSREYLTKYIGLFHDSPKGCSILEIGCGEGGNLVPYAENRCKVYGIDISKGKILNAQLFFSEKNLTGRFTCDDFLQMDISGFIGMFDIIIAHDVIEHICPEEKDKFMQRAMQLLKTGGVMMAAFPSWQMPFGGHQQICRRRFARIPFIHLLPKKIYEAYLKICREEEWRIEELMSIRESRMSIEIFEGICKKRDITILDRTLWLINPHYKVKFGLTPRKLNKWICNIKWLRRHLTTSCFYILSNSKWNIPL